MNLRLLCLMQKRYKKIRGVSIIVMLGLKNAGIDLQPQILERCQEEKETIRSFVMTLLCT